jgi:HTH-type transcriptional regulator/antitoxin HigA
LDPKVINEERYAELLAQARPAIIESPEEHERLLGVAEQLMEKGEQLTPEERRLLALIVFLIDAFETGIEEDDDEEEEGDRVEPPAPFETLQRLMQARGLAVSDVEHFFGNAHLAREVLAGKRPISRGQAKELGKFFKVPPKLFH